MTTCHLPIRAPLPPTLEFAGTRLTTGVKIAPNTMTAMPSAHVHGANAQNANSVHGYDKES